MGRQGIASPRRKNARRNPIAGHMLIAAGILIGIFAILAFVVMLPVGDDDASSSFLTRFPDFVRYAILRIPAGTPAIVLVSPGVLLGVAGIALIKHGRRHVAARYSSQEYVASGDTILYLRPFVADSSSVPDANPFDSALLTQMLDRRQWAQMFLAIRGITRYEELLAHSFRRIGTMVTIGDPKERLPQLGATRVYAASAADGTAGKPWKTVVAEQIQGAKLILFHVGRSDALHWEIETVIAAANPHIAAADPTRIVLCVNPPKRDHKIRGGAYGALRANTNATWKDFREAYGCLFPRGLPETLGDARFILFDADWKPRALLAAKRKLVWFWPSRTVRPASNTVAGVLDWLTWLIVPEPTGRRWARRGINYFSFVVILLSATAIFIFVAR